MPIHVWSHKKYMLILFLPDVFFKFPIQEDKRKNAYILLDRRIPMSFYFQNFFPFSIDGGG